MDCKCGGKCFTKEEAPDGSKAGPYMVKWFTKGFGRRWSEGGIIFRKPLGGIKCKCKKLTKSKKEDLIGFGWILYST